MPQQATKTRPVRRVLIYRLGSLGDTVVALPSLRLVARAFPQSERRMLTNFPVQVKAPPAEAILQSTGLVQGYFRYAVGTRSVAELARLWWQLRSWRPDVLIYLAPPRGIKAVRRDRRFFQLCGISRIIGLLDTEDLQQNREAADGTLEPEAERLARTLAELGDAHLDDPASWDLALTGQELAAGKQALSPLDGKPLIALSIGTKASTNDWGEANWYELLRRLGELYPGYGLALTGAAVDIPYSEAIARGWQAAQRTEGTVLNLCDRLTPRESAAVFQQARVYLGHDSGPMHLAAAVQTPCVAVFSARGKPRTWFPYGRQHRVIYHRTECWGCGLTVCIEEKKRCINSITVDEVLREIHAVLDSSTTHQGMR